MELISPRHYFDELQTFRQSWTKAFVWGPSLVLLGMAGFNLYDLLWLVKPLGETTAADQGQLVGSVIMILIGFGLPVLFSSISLHIQVNDHEVYIRFKPFRTRHIPLEQIVSCAAEIYRPIMDYGGWGIKYSLRFRRWAYNVSGNRGVVLDLADGKSLLLGSQRPEELASAIQSAKTARKG